MLHEMLRESRHYSAEYGARLVNHEGRAAVTRTRRFLAGAVMLFAASLARAHPSVSVVIDSRGTSISPTRSTVK